MRRVNPRLAQEAADLLCLDLASATAEDVVVAYRTAALTAHPDRGGTTDGFNELKHARDVLDAYVKEPKPVKAPPECLSCGGKGFVMKQRGWRASRQVCPMCRGKGHTVQGEDQ